MMVDKKFCTDCIHNDVCYLLKAVEDIPISYFTEEEYMIATICKYYSKREVEDEDTGSLVD